MIARAARLLALVLTLPLALTACDEVLNGDFATVTQDLSYEIPVDFPIAYPGASALEQLQNDGEDRFPIQFYIPIDLQGQASWLANSSVVDEVRIVGVTMQISDNTLSTPIEPVELRIGAATDQRFEAPGTRNESFEAALQVATTPVVALQDPAFTGPVQAEVVAANSSAAGQRIAALDFGVGLGTELVIPEGNLPASGRANARFTLDLEFVINPIN